MKKTFIIITSLLLICVMLIGCNSTDATIQASKELNKNLNLLYNTVNRLDTVDNEYLVSNDIYELNKINASNVPSPNKTRTRVLAKSNLNEPQVSYTTIQEIPDSLEDTKVKLTSTEDLKADEISLKDDLTQALKNELINRLYCDSNGNCKLCKNKYTCSDNGVCNSCNQTVICDSNGNCTSCKNTLVLDNNNNCSSCKKSCVTTTPNTNLNSQTKSCLQKISANNQKLDVELLSTNNNDLVVKNDSDKVDTLTDTNINIHDTNNNVIDNNTIVKNNNVNNIDTNNTDNNITNYDNNTIKNTIDLPKEEIIVTTDSTDTSNNVDNQIITKTERPVVISDSNLSNSDNTMNNNSTDTDVVLDDSTDNNTNTDSIVRFEPYKVIYYSESSFTPDLLKYNPRFINSINYDSANNTLSKYVEKLQKLYTMTADVVEANNTLANYKVVILDNIHDAKELNECVLNGNCTPNANQVSALNNYIEDIKTTIKNLRNTNGTLTNEINKISSNNTGLAQSIDIANSNYLKILNQIDTRISYHENAIATLEQIKYLLQDAQNNNGVTVVENLNNNTNVTTDINRSNDTLDNTKVETIIDDKNIIVEDNSNITPVTPNNDVKKEEKVTTTNELVEVEKTIDENGNVVVDKKIITPDNSIVTNIEDDNNEIITNNDSLNDSTIVKETIVTENNDNLNSNEEFNNDSFLDKKTFSNVDTYNQNLKNVDTYKKEVVLNDATNQVQENNDNIVINDNIDTNNNSEIVNNNDNLNTTNEVVTDNNDTIINPNNTPQMVDNTNNFGVTGNNYNNGLNNGYNNTIISQNNLDNNDLGNNSYRYDGNGSLYNNTNGYNNGTINNVNERNNNVNTYKYNTLIDSINRGTVNNGINTLKVSA